MGTALQPGLGAARPSPGRPVVALLGSLFSGFARRLGPLAVAGSDQRAAAAAVCAEPLAERAFRAVLELVIELLGGLALADSFLAVCRWWFSAAVCHPGSFRAPVEAWRLGACRQLDEQLARMREPPGESELEDLRVGLEHAEEELRLTELSASFPSGVTVVLLRFARRLSGLLRWVNAGPPGRLPGAPPGCAQRRRYLRQEAREFRRRVSLLSGAVRELRARLPDPELPIRWAQWFEEAGELAGFPEGHCMRYRSQREQVAAVWANNRRTFLSTDEHVDALAQSLGELDDLVGSSEDEAGRDDEAPACCGGLPGACGAGLAACSRALRSAREGR
mmetsp:Transcript_65620/g.211739  ORF Transcript_65620/g.211739 Transcript_65620/m.211739 type:complete len:335 (+) Transcript_65620:92-1096(+)